MTTGSGTAIRWIVWAGLLFGFWLVLAGEWSWIEAGAAAAAAAAGATAAVLVQRLPGVSARVPAPWLKAAWPVPVAIVADFGIVTWVLVCALARRERVHGKFRVKPFPVTGDDATVRGIRTWVTVAATVSPNAYVVHIDADAGDVLLHDLVTRPISDSPA
jgi:hypothetical protein